MSGRKTGNPAQLRGDIAAGRAGGKRPGFDPAAALPGKLFVGGLAQAKPNLTLTLTLTLTLILTITLT